MQQDPTNPKEMTMLLTARETAKALNVSLSAVYRLGQRGVLPRHQIGRAVRFDIAEVRQATRAECSENVAPQ